MDASVELTKIGTVGLVTVDGPYRNALDPDLVRGVTSALVQADEDAAITAVVVASNGPSFCSGANLKLLRSVAADPLEDAAFDSLGAIYSLFEFMQRYPLPTVAAVNGALVGAGMNLALACDLRVVAGDVEIRGFGQAGVHPGGGHVSMLVQRVGRMAAAAIVLFDQPLDGPAAVSTGLAHECVPLGELRDRAIQIAAGAGTDKALVRRTVATYRASAASALAPDAAVMLERAPQVWSLHRRFPHKASAAVG